MLIAISVIVCMISSLGTNLNSISFLLFNTQAILHGQIWRLVTPIFIHFGLIHILFNTFAIYQLGCLVEHYHSRFYVIYMFLVFSIISNVVQNVMVGPMFGGLSGLIYGIFGYLWIYGVRCPSASFRLSKNSIITILVWYGLCWTGLLGSIANWAHTGGLLTGMIFAYYVTGSDYKPRTQNSIDDKRFDDL